jgi:very-short-patch-repair endonuclease
MPAKPAKVKNVNSTVTGNRSKAEQLIIDMLRFHFKRLNVSKNDKSLLGGRQEMDIYLPDYKYCIEVDGITHQRPVFGQETFDRMKAADKRKEEKLEVLNIRLFRVKLPENSSKTVEVIKAVLPELVSDIKAWIALQEVKSL